MSSVPASDSSIERICWPSNDNSPMLVVNGADDYFVPQSDTLVFQGRPHTEVHLVEGTGHVAMSKAPR